MIEKQAGASRRKDGKFYGQGHVKQPQQAKSGWNFLPGSIQPFPFISACGVSVCQWQTSCEPTEPTGETTVWVKNAPGTLRLFLTISACGSRCGSRATTSKSVPHHAKQDDEKTSTIFRKICKTQTAQKQGNTVLSHCKSQPIDLKKKQRNRTIMRFLRLWWGRVDSNH